MTVNQTRVLHGKPTGRRRYQRQRQSVRDERVRVWYAVVGCGVRGSAMPSVRKEK
jgi:hypothetical protein